MSLNRAEQVAQTVGVISTYCRVMEVHIQSIAQGTAPLIEGKGAREWAQAVQEAGQGIKREVEFLRFLRESSKESLGEQ